MNVAFQWFRVMKTSEAKNDQGQADRESKSDLE